MKAVKTVDPDHLGLITKVIEKDGAAYNTPNDYAEVLVSWEGFLADDTQFDQVRASVWCCYAGMLPGHKMKDA